MVQTAALAIVMTVAIAAFASILVLLVTRAMRTKPELNTTKPPSPPPGGGDCDRACRQANNKLAGYGSDCTELACPGCPVHRVWCDNQCCRVGDDGQTDWDNRVPQSWTPTPPVPGQTWQAPPEYPRDLTTHFQKQALAVTSTRKRGFGYQVGFPTTPEGDTPDQQLSWLRQLGCSWWYNWGAAPVWWRRDVPDDGRPLPDVLSQLQGVEFVAMQWGPWGFDSLEKELPDGVRYLLGFNEPNIRGQAAITPQQCAAYWPFLERVAARFNLKLGSASPSHSDGQLGPGNAREWHEEFFRAYPQARVDFFCVHHYSCEVEWLRGEVDAVRGWGKPVWVTEFACPTAARGPQNVDYLKKALAYLDGDPAVERYAIFGAVSNSYNDDWLGNIGLVYRDQGGHLTELGKLYSS